MALYMLPFFQPFVIIFKHTEKLEALCVKCQYTHHTVLSLVLQSVFSRDLSVKLNIEISSLLNK